MGYQIIELSLSNFRNYKLFNIESLNSLCIFVHGKNGCGKTNLLEAISLLGLSKGLRNASPNSYANAESGNNLWAVSSVIKREDRLVELSTGVGDDLKRLFYINGIAKNQPAVLEQVQFISLTPQMDGLFLDSPSARRQFLDRLVSTLDSAHINRINEYDKAVRERNSILLESNNQKWLDAVEMKIVELGITISSQRMIFLEELQNRSLVREGVFPKLEIYQECVLEEWLRAMPSIEAEAKYKEVLKANRDSDRMNKSTAIGVHRSDFKVKFLLKNMDAANCSTGEQKIIMISMLLAYADLLNNRYKSYPIFLLDEVFVHLDSAYQKALMDELLLFKTQVWISGVNKDILPEYEGFMHFIKLGE